MEYSLVIPVYNEQDSLKILHRKIVDVFLQDKSSFEIIYVDDNSSDGSLNILRSLAREDNKVKIIAFSAHHGQSSALFFGFKASRGNWIITLDADLQNDPSAIKEFLPLKNSFDLINGIREKRQDAFLKIISSRLAYFARRLVLGDETLDTGCSLRMFKREILDYIPCFNNFHRFFPYLVKRAGFNTTYIKIQHFPRKFGSSKYGIWGRLKAGMFDLLGVYWLSKRLIKK